VAPRSFGSGLHLVAGFRAGSRVVGMAVSPPPFAPNLGHNRHGQDVDEAIVLQQGPGQISAHPVIWMSKSVY